MSVIDGRAACQRLADPDRRPTACPCRWSASTITVASTDILEADRELTTTLARLLELMP